MTEEQEAFRRSQTGHEPDRVMEPGTIARTPVLIDPRCRNLCTGSDRPVWDSPAKLGRERGTGRKVVYCPCCSRELLTYEKTLDMKGVTWYATNIRPPNLNPGLAADQQRFVDIICRYDVVMLWNIVEVDRVAEE
jgi:hypothetical protein